jgi:hypothetical protein
LLCAQQRLSSCAQGSGMILITVKLHPYLILLLLVLLLLCVLLMLCKHLSARLLLLLLLLLCWKPEQRFVGGHAVLDSWMRQQLLTG